LTFELVVVVFAILAIFGYIRASAIHKKERDEERNSENGTGDDNAMLLREHSGT
jgi:hypothetical protein